MSPAPRGRDPPLRREDLRDASTFEFGEQFAEAIREDGDLDLLEQDAHDAGAVAGLEEERPVAGLTDGAGHETVGRVEEIASSRHGLTLYRIPVETGRRAQAPRTRDMSQPRAPSGAGGVCASVWVSPVPSVARTRMV